jgi:hypothetical protein
MALCDQSNHDKLSNNNACSPSDKTGSGGGETSGSLSLYISVQWGAFTNTFFFHDLFNCFKTIKLPEKVY